jgi:UPF0755 protein
MILRSIAVLLLVLSAVLAWAWQDYQAFIARPIVAQELVIMEIAKGSSFRSIIQQLDSQTGLQQADIDKLWFKILAHQLGLITQLKAGEYLLPVGQTPTKFLLLLSRGITRQHSITFPEGWTFKQIRQTLSADKDLKLTLTGISDSEILQQIGSTYTHPEGLFFPDTYRFDITLITLTHAINNCRIGLQAHTFIKPAGKYPCNGWSFRGNSRFLFVY